MVSEGMKRIINMLKQQGDVDTKKRVEDAQRNGTNDCDAKNSRRCVN
ncbi:MAG: hypothetical protein ACXAB8_05800 [Promethearchaeota archaeon]|jgi:hypothetical protein